jgi:hypothetical protein
MIITGNPVEGLAESLCNIWPDAEFASRETGYDLTKGEHMYEFAEACTRHDQIILNSALWRFNQTVLLDIVYKKLVEAEKSAHIVCVGSTIDRTDKGTTWLYSAEKKALRDYCNSLGIIGVWQDGPKVSYISFGTLSNKQDKHPDRICMDIDVAAEYIKWIFDQPKHLSINELSIDPMQV